MSNIKKNSFYRNLKFYKNRKTDSEVKKIISWFNKIKTEMINSVDRKRKD